MTKYGTESATNLPLKRSLDHNRRSCTKRSLRSTHASSLIGPCATETPQSVRGSTYFHGRVASAFWWCRCIRNTRQQQQRPYVTKFSESLARMRWQPSLRVAPPYYDNPVYIEAVTKSLQAELAKLPFTPQVIIASFHGMPKEYLLRGDPYYCQCSKTARLLRENLKLNEATFLTTFQSRFGKTEWLQPYTDVTVRNLAKSGIKNLAVITPGFAADCLETLEEIAMENAAIFKQTGGENFIAIPCLNDTDEGMRVIREVALTELKGWL